MSDTGKKRDNNGKKPYRIGKGKPPVHSRFSASNQPRNRRKPSPETFVTEGVPVLPGIDRNRIKTLLNNNYHFPEGSQIKQQLVRTFGFEIEEMKAGEIIILQQIQKAILKGDSLAFEKLFNQALGMPQQEIRAATVSKLIIEVVHDDRELLAGIGTGIHPVD